LKTLEKQFNQIAEKRQAHHETSRPEPSRREPVQAAQSP